MRIIVLLLIIVLFSCTSSPVGAPAQTTAKANMDQAKYLDSIHQQLKRIADKMEGK